MFHIVVTSLVSFPIQLFFCLIQNLIITQNRLFSGGYGHCKVRPYFSALVQPSDSRLFHLRANLLFIK
ncbi:hypothetical protein L596_001682 [Steinernema carpocapsae]|uniref:Uncharacterized protein n=1 Tax=Steinernema carpocapsae TaxID=34508 RepID=A0A4U8UPL5_STECR|nr:hypothetical protein L596_001682 [Steinernema carpocapsae]